MLEKLLKAHKLSPLARSDLPKPANPMTPEKLEIASSALMIIHAGGRVECYLILLKYFGPLTEYPSHALAKPEVFRRPWNSVVRPEKILTPGQKFLLVPHHAVRKLRRKIGKPSEESSSSSSSSVSLTSQASNDVSTDMVSRQNNNDVSSRSFFSESDISTGVSRDSSCSFRSALRKKTGVKKHVRYAGIAVKHKGGHNSTNSEKKGNRVDHNTP
ncbi:hypothetical protein NC653_007212 [Populus alba x Populus x berolinensis]|uniref:Uncharacterized protein n=1 Tax=Populus alba x Populus x berolinensis TaxID=444605 RepID=A0AAD6RHE1_9ROSI|nr:hypothetical protein NC653_007212 [Populus alba x Populus x berolinensis]